MAYLHAALLCIQLKDNNGKATGCFTVPCVAGAGLLPSYEGGKAVRCAQEAVNLCKAASKAAAVFDQTAPRTAASEHQSSDAAFTELITITFNKVCKALFLPAKLHSRASFHTAGSSAFL